MKIFLVMSTMYLLLVLLYSFALLTCTWNRLILWIRNWRVRHRSPESPGVDANGPYRAAA